MKAFVKKNVCMFCGMCGGICPDVFKADTDGKSTALDIEISEELLPEARHAEFVCPTGAATIRDAE